MSIPKRHLFAYEAAAAAGNRRATAELERHRAGHKRRLARSLPRRKAAAATRAERAGFTTSVRVAVANRAASRCECCGGDGLKLEMDHFFGRARSENVESCWALCYACHLQKTTNLPGRRFWLMRFERHCTTNGLGRALPMVRQLLALEQGKGATT